jgi:hypothetical protein
LTKEVIGQKVILLPKRERFFVQKEKLSIGNTFNDCIQKIDKNNLKICILTQDKKSINLATYKTSKNLQPYYLSTSAVGLLLYSHVKSTPPATPANSTTSP